MSKTLKILIGIAVGLVVAGVLLTLIAFAAVGFDAGKLGAGKFETKEYTIEEPFEGVSVSVQTADVTFCPSEDGAVRVECYEGEKQPHTVGVVDGKLTVVGGDQRKWYEKITVFSKSPKIKVYLPAGEYATLKLKTDTGDVTIPETVTFGTVGIETDTGDVELAGGSPTSVKIETDTGDVTYSKSNPGAVAIETDTGDVTLKDVVGTGDAKIDTDTGDVEFDRCDAANYDIRTATGDVKGTLLTGKLFTASTHTGSIKLPDQDPSGGSFRVATHTGDVKIRIAE